MKELPANKILRSGIKKKQKIEKKKQKKKEKEERRRQAEALGEDWRKTPVTLEDKREKELAAQSSSELQVNQNVLDEFAEVFTGQVEPRVVLVPGLKPTRATYDFIAELLRVIPNSVFYERKKSNLREASLRASAQGFTDAVFIEENRKQVTGITHIHLAKGPCAYYRIKRYCPSKKIPGHGRSSEHKPEVILSNFKTALGVRIGRMLGALFSLRPDYHGRQVVTLHNQRDFIFFRCHRYEFRENGQKVALQEQGPRFTMKLQRLVKGLVGDENAETEFVETNSRKSEFFL
eukprot:jgi/Galph1/5468/GphlegSOOS_G4108.1